MMFKFTYGEPFTILMNPGDTLLIRSALGDGELQCPNGLTVESVQWGTQFQTTYRCARFATVKHTDLARDISRSEFDEYRMGIVEFLRYREMLLKRYRQ